MNKILRYVYVTACLIFMAGTVQAAGEISDALSISQLLLNVLKFLLYVSGVFAIIGLVVSGIMYVVSAGDEAAMRSAKSYAENCAIGLLVATLSLVIAKTITTILGS